MVANTFNPSTREAEADLCELEASLVLTTVLYTKSTHGNFITSTVSYFISDFPKMCPVSDAFPQS